MSALVKFTGLCVAAAFVVFAISLTFFQVNETLSLRKKLADTEERLEQLGIDHRDTMDALNRAQITREEIHERARRQQQALDSALADHPLADELVPDEWRMCLQWDENGDCALPAPANSPDGYKNPLPQGNTNGGRHGQNPR